jgi:hypothetical protein
MAKYSGKELVVHWLPSTGGTVNFTADSRTFEHSGEAGEINVTTRSDAILNAEAFLAGPTGRTWQLQALDTRGTAQAWEQIVEGDEGTIRWWPEGTASGKRQREAAALVRQIQFQSPYDNAAQVTVGGRLTAAISKTTVT